MSKLLILGGVILALGSAVLGLKLKNQDGAMKDIPTLSTPVTPLLVKNENKNIKRVKTINLNPDRTILILGEIGNNALTAAQTIKELEDQSNDPIYLILDSPGGSVIDGNVLVSAIESSSAPVYTVCHRICASMAAVIHQYGKQRMMVDRSVLMFHQASASSQGTIDEMKSMTDFLYNYIEKTERFIANRAGMPYDQYKLSNMKNIWIDSEDATAKKFNDQIISINIQSSEIVSELKQYNTKGRIKDVQWKN